MKVKTISYAKVFPLAAYVNEKIGVEIELDEHDDWEENFSLAKRMVEKFHKDNNPQLTDGDGKVTIGHEPFAHTFTPHQPIPEVDPKKKDTEEKINDATTPHELDLLFGDAAKYNLVSQFNEKKKMLQ